MDEESSCNKRASMKTQRRCGLRRGADWRKCDKAVSRLEFVGPDALQQRLHLVAVAFFVCDFSERLQALRVEHQ